MGRVLYRVGASYATPYFKMNGVDGPKEISVSAGFGIPIMNAYNNRSMLHQGFPHCAIFPTAASRRSLGRVSVPMWPFTLSGRLWIVALVGRYPAN